MKLIKIIIVVYLITIIAIPLSGQEISKVATSAAQFLKFGIGARAAALGNALTGIEDDVSALYWNPAGVASVDRTSLMVSHLSLFADLSHNFVGLVIPISGTSTFGLSATYLGSGDIEVTTITEPNGTGAFYDYHGLCVGLTYSRHITDRLTVGITGKLIEEGLYREQARTVALDFGSLLETGLLGIKVGMVLSNFGGSMRLDGPDLRVEHDRFDDNVGDPKRDADLKTDNWPLPMTYRIGIAMDLMGANSQFTKSEMNRLTFAADFSDPNDALLRSNLGVEYEWNNIFALRVGYRGLPLASDEYDTYETASYAFGGGLNYDIGGWKFQADYALSNYGRLDNIHQFTLGLQF